MAKSLPKKLRAKWDALIATEGAALGLSDCRVFLENKMVNDIFYEGLFKGRPCIVKCSSRAPDSILNEYEMSKRLFAEAPVCAEPLAHYVTPNGKMAFVVTERIVPGTLPSDPAADILRIARTLRQTGIVHRDISINNLLTGADGHLKLIDLQFAIDRRQYHESAYMRRHPVYLYVTFGTCSDCGLGRWNDCAGFGLIACLDRLAPRARQERKRLVKMLPTMTFSAPLPGWVRPLVCLRHSVWALQNRFSPRQALQWRLVKSSRLLKGKDWKMVGSDGNFLMQKEIIR